MRDAQMPIRVGKLECLLRFWAKTGIVRHVTLTFCLLRHVSTSSSGPISLKKGEVHVLFDFEQLS